MPGFRIPALLMSHLMLLKPLPVIYYRSLFVEISHYIYSYRAGLLAQTHKTILMRKKLNTIVNGSISFNFLRGSPTPTLRVSATRPRVAEYPPACCWELSSARDFLELLPESHRIGNPCEGLLRSSGSDDHDRSVSEHSSENALVHVDGLDLGQVHLQGAA